MQAGGKRHRQKRITIFRVPAKSGLCQIFSAIELLLEASALLRISFIFLPRAEDRIVLIELRFQHAQSVEFGEQDSCRLARRPHGIIGVQFFPRLEFFLSTAKIQVIEQAKSVIESRRGQLGNRSGSQQQHESGTERGSESGP